ncbi:DUF6508 domain-containing protein [Paenibacillus turicensis]|uniref:DUF6508 domain-containing protein n=1 Tax=Paenibacillus turicensis TaxID=160487 RepID=UPI003D2D79A0
MSDQNHNNYHQLLQFIPFFESNEPKYTVENELSFDPFRYSEKFYEFIMLASEMLVIVGFDWHTFSEEQITTRENLAEQVKEMDFDTIRKWITTITRQERYCSGTYAQMIDQGVFLAILQRIKQLLDDGSIQTP